MGNYFSLSKLLPTPTPSLIRAWTKAFSLRPLLNKRRKAAFTLSEVLITLGVIGVVAALTMPSLIANYQKKVWVNQLKTTYSKLNEGFRQMMAKEGCTDLQCVGVIVTIPSGASLSAEYKNFFKSKVLETFKLSNVTNFDELSLTSNTYQYTVKAGQVTTQFAMYIDENLKESYYRNGFFGTTPDGAILFFDFPYGNNINEGAMIIADINGQKGPNTLGRDIFWFMLTDKQVVTYGGRLSWEFSNTDETYDEYSEIMKNACLYYDVGVSCAGLIENDGWKMNY